MLDKNSGTNRAVQPPVFAIVTNAARGIYCGWVEYYDPIANVAIIRDCRHVFRWFGRPGGITSLARYGICGAQANDSKIGAPCLATIGNVANIFECSPEARESLIARSA